MNAVICDRVSRVSVQEHFLACMQCSCDRSFTCCVPGSTCTSLTSLTYKLHLKPIISTQIAFAQSIRRLLYTSSPYEQIARERRVMPMEQSPPNITPTDGHQTNPAPAPRDQKQNKTTNILAHAKKTTRHSLSIRVSTPPLALIPTPPSSMTKHPPDTD
jgi:hypothetical protein